MIKEKKIFDNKILKPGTLVFYMEHWSEVNYKAGIIKMTTEDIVKIVHIDSTGSVSTVSLKIDDVVQHKSKLKLIKICSDCKSIKDNIEEEGEDNNA